MSDSTIQVPCPKGTGTVDVDINLLPPEVYRELILQGAKVLLGRGMSKITKALYEGDDAKMHADARAKAEENLQAMYDGKIKITGAPKATKVSGAEKTEAMRLARAKVKEVIKANGGKISHFKASDITAAAKELIEADPSFIEQARALLEAREKEPAKVDIMSLIHADPKLVADAQAKAAEKKASAPLSAKQAGKVKPRKQAEATA